MDDIPLISRISDLYKRMSHAAMRAGRSPEEITLIAVSKTASIERIKEAIDAGQRVFGENRVQEAQGKIAECGMQNAESRIEWHLIGHLQKNKAKYAVRLFDVIHSLDSRELAEELSRQAEKIGKVQDLLIEVKLSHEETKHGVSEEELVPLIETIGDLTSLRVRGLMTMPPYFEDPDHARPYFRRLRELRDKINEMRIANCYLPDLSIGMSNDFEVAIEEGSTMVRVGTAIFGERR